MHVSVLFFSSLSYLPSGVDGLFLYHWYQVIAMATTTAEVSTCDQVAGPVKGVTGWLKLLCYWLYAAFCQRYVGRSAVSLACTQLCCEIGKQSRHLNTLQKTFRCLAVEMGRITGSVCMASCAVCLHEFENKCGNKPAMNLLTEQKTHSWYTVSLIGKCDILLGCIHNMSTVLWGVKHFLHLFV